MQNSLSTYQFQQRCISSWTGEFLFCSDETWTVLLTTGADDPSRNVGYPYVASILLKLHSGKAIFVRCVNLIHPGKLETAPFSFYRNKKRTKL